jgi:hypothetical protein
MHKVAYDFPGITVIVPDQPNGIKLVAIDKGTIPDINKSKDGFEVIRYIVNIALLNEEDYKSGNLDSGFVTHFYHPIEFRVGYNFQDVMESQDDIHRLKLAYWDSDTSHWVIVSNAVHEYQILPPGTGQVAEFKIRSWSGDPPIAWGK